MRLDHAGDTSRPFDVTLEAGLQQHRERLSDPGRGAEKDGQPPALLLRSSACTRCKSSLGSGRASVIEILRVHASKA